MILLLEDNAERLSELLRVLHSVAPEIPVRVWNDAYQMMAEAETLFPEAYLISLDHDLEPELAGRDPGEGYSVVKFLVSQPVVVPVILHTSNGERARWMAGELELAGWKFWRVPALGDDWITSHWRDTVVEILRAHK